MPQTQAQLLIKGIRHTKKIGASIQHEHYRPALKEYIVERLDIKGKEGMVNWKAIGHYNRTLSLQRRSTRAKFITRWTPTELRQFKLKLSATPYCPLCKTELESTTHVTRCKSPLAVRHRSIALDVLENKLVKWHTHPELITLAITILTNEVAPVFLRNLTSNDPHVQQVIASQHTLGWHLLKLGFITDAWQEFQINLLERSGTDQPTREGIRWSNNMQAGLWEYTSSTWKA